MVEDGSRIATEALGELPVRHRLVEGEAQDAEAQRMGERPHLGRRRVAQGTALLGSD